MRNYHEKPRDMGRSALPSTRRKGAREDLRDIKQRNRNATRQLLHDYKYYDEYEDFEGFVTDYPDARINEAVRERRYGDKLSVVRWAERVSVTRLRHVRQRDLHGAFKNLMPDTTAGRHILSHVMDAVDPLYGNRIYTSWWGGGIEEYVEFDPKTNRYSINWDRRIADRFANNKEEVRRAKLQEIAEKYHKRFNRVLRNNHACDARTPFDPPWKAGPDLVCVGCGKYRLFGGLHDIEGFMKHRHANLPILDKFEP